jgi:multicomponent Na+:H+ antiporter subunit D
VFQLQLLLFSGLAFFLMLRALKRTLTITLDVDWLWRCLGPALFRALDEWTDRLWDGLARGAVWSARAVVEGVQRYCGPDGILACSWPTGSMAFWTGVVLAAYLLVLYI